MRKIDRLLAEYGESHQQPTNKLIHWICVPIIFWSILGFISLIPVPSVALGFLGKLSYLDVGAIVFVTIFYARLSPMIAVLMFLLMLLMEYWVGLTNAAWGTSAWMVYLAVFVIAWIFQFIGHKIEGKKPSFFKDIQFLLIGPSWLLSFVLRRFGIQY
ncbi:MAG: DUF962 domain-containing protein [Neisseria sp.]|nr:DUF962 domain-containing protein [Neisseria sp.]